jgi:hypothetical protein
MERKLDIWDLLSASDRRKGDWFSKQSPEAQKEFAIPVVMRWAATVDDGIESSYMLMAINDRVNINLYDITKHPELIYRLIASCGLGKKLKHQWIPGIKRKALSSKAYAVLEECYPEANEKELDILMSQYNKKSFATLLDDCGTSAADAKEIMKDFNKIGESK